MDLFSQNRALTSKERDQSRKVVVGTSGYYYKDWRGSFYPPSLKKQRMLLFYAEHFDAVELNFTYYGIPKPEVLIRMVNETPKKFMFIVKANKEMTHGEKSDSVCSQFKKAIEPICEGNKFGGILVQFPMAFKDTPESRKYLLSLRSKFAGYPFIVEFRNRDWQKEEIFDLLTLNKCSYCCVDVPPIPELPDNRARFTADPAYVRFHSRDISRWFAAGGKERYNYLYTNAELEEWIPKIERLSSQAQKVFIFFNNCHRAYAVKNAKEIEMLLAGELR